MKTPLALITCVAVLLPLPASAELFTIHTAAPGIWAIEGPAEQRNPENLANNATFGLIETSEGAILVDPGGTWAGAKLLDETVQTLTNQPVKYVINTGGQDHRWLGNGYWQDQGATVIASTAAVADQTARGSMQLSMLAQLVPDGLTGTAPTYADITFDDTYSLTLGERQIEVRHPGAAHTPGDSFVWLPDSGVIFAGDIVYVGRILGVMEFSDSSSWLHSFEALAALNPTAAIPGHGPLTTLDRATTDTYDYLQNLRTQIGTHIDKGGDIISSVEVDQSAFSYLDQFDALAKRNAQTVYDQMEWE